MNRENRNNVKGGLNKLKNFCCVILFAFAVLVGFKIAKNLAADAAVHPDSDSKISTSQTTVTSDDKSADTSVSDESDISKLEEEINNNTGSPAEVVEQDIEVVDGRTYINGILVVNKTYNLPKDYNPGLDSKAEEMFGKMAADAAEEGIYLYICSGFRSYWTQADLYNSYVYSYGQEATDTFSARAGYSEHQSGLAMDINRADDSFLGTPEAIWLEKHCSDYGFIIRYPDGKQDKTGFKYEPWHIRYLGIDTAKAVNESGLCLEEYLGITSEYADN